MKLLGDVAGDMTQKVTVPKDPPRMYGLTAADSHGVSPSPVPFRVSDLDNFIEAEPNNDVKTANAFPSAPYALNGVISEADDADYFKFTAKKGQQFDVRVHARSVRSPLDPVLTILRSNGGGLASNDDSGGPDSYVRFNPPADGEYFVVVRDHLHKGGGNYVYRVELTPVKPALTLSLPEVRRYQDVTVAVPQGNHMAVMFSASRQGFGGELNLEFPNLPPGMKAETIPMPANQSVVPVLFTAASDAPLGGALAEVIGRHADPKTGIAGHLAQNSLLVRGQNNSRVWEHESDRTAVVLTEASPYSLQIVQPKAPLVRNGSMNLKVVATRKEGFKSPITVKMLYNPPGVGSSSSVTIPADKNEADLRLNANGGAAVGVWKIVVLGQATVGNGPVEVASPYADLSIAEAFFSFAFQTAAVEQGQPTDVVVKVTQNTPFEGAAKVELLGLPNKVTAEPVELTKDAQELVFKVSTDKVSPAGRHKTLLCRAVLTLNGESVTHNLGTGELRIDKPLPPKPNAPPKPAVAAKPAEKKPVVKRLTRLEQLRLEREAAKKAEESGGGGA